jgi:hypothetical protein
MPSGRRPIRIRERRTMAKADRVLERLRRLPPEMQFSEIETLLRSRGWTIR